MPRPAEPRPVPASPPPLSSDARAPDWALAGAVFLACVLLLRWRTGVFAGVLGELTTLVERSYLAGRGLVAYRDFDCVTTPLTHLLHGWAWRLFGFDYGVTRALVAVQGAVLAAATYLLLRLCAGLGRGPSLLSAALCLVWSPNFITGLPWYNSDACAFILAAAGVLLWGWERPGRLTACAVGALATLGFWCKQDLGAAAILLGWAVVVLRAVPRGGRDLAFDVAAYELAVVCAFAPFLAYFAMNGALGDAWHWTVRRAILFRVEGIDSGLLVRLGHSLFGGRSHVGKLLLAFYVAAGAIPLWLLRRAPGEPGLLRNACVSLFLGGVYFAGFVTHDGTHFERMQPGLGLAAGLLWDALERLGRAGALPDAARWRVALGAVLVALGSRSLKYLQNELSYEPGPMRELAGARWGGLKMPGPLADRVESAARFIEAAVPASEDFAVLPPERLGPVHFLTGRLPSIPATTGMEWAEEDDARVQAVLEKRRVPCLILLESAAPAPGLEGFVATRYARSEKVAEGVWAWRLRDTESSSRGP